MKQKLAWADANAITPPAHARAIGEAEGAKAECCKKKACCPPKPAVVGVPVSAGLIGLTESKDRLKPGLQQSPRWLTVADVQGCHGKPADALGTMTMPPAVAGHYVRLRADVPPAFDWLTPFDISAPPRVADISTPPPKLG